MALYYRIQNEFWWWVSSPLNCPSQLPVEYVAFPAWWSPWCILNVFGSSHFQQWKSYTANSRRAIHYRGTRHGALSNRKVSYWWAEHYYYCSDCMECYTVDCGAITGVISSLKLSWLFIGMTSTRYQTQGGRVTRWHWKHMDMYSCWPAFLWSS